MTYDEFWFENPFRVKAYDEAYKIKREMEKYGKWEQGAYFYESLVNTSILFRDFAKKGKPEPYPEKPYGIEEKPKTELELLEEAENERLKAKIHFDMLFRQMAKHFENKVGDK